MQLPLRDGVGVATLGPQLKLKKNTFQGVVVQVREVAIVTKVLEGIRHLPRLHKYQHFPYAVRLRVASSLHPTVLLRPEQDDEKKIKKIYRPPEDPMVMEDWEDDGEVGVGDRLLHVLQRWQVENVVLVIARYDDSLSGRLIGHELFKLMAETAKLTLEQYYLSNIKPSDATKLEIYEAERGHAQYMLSPRESSDTPPRPPPQYRASVCLMTSDTIASWPQHHQPTSDGGGRKGTKKGRINHFLHGRTSSLTTIADTVIDNNTAEDTVSPEASDALLARGGIDWLGITRDEWLKLRTIRVPVKELHYLFMCLVVLVEKPLEAQFKAAATSRQNEQFNAPSYSWNRCREVLQRTAQWSDTLRTFHGSALTKSQAIALRSVLQEPTVNESAFLRICSASVKLFSWIQRLLDEYDAHALGMISATAPGVEPLSPVPPPPESPSPMLLPQPPATKPSQRKPTKQSLALHLAEEKALACELNALSNGPKTKIIDRGRLLSPKLL